MSADMSVSPQIRVIFVGDTNVGKTALNTRYLQNDFNPDGAPTVSPASTSATAKTASGKEVTLQLWDTAGQERFQSLSQLFYREAKVAIICVDGSNPDSFETVKTWGKRVQESEPTCKFVIAVTKIDLVGDDRSEVKRLSDKVSKEEDIDDVIETSAKTGEGVQELFIRVATLGDGDSNDKQKTESNENSTPSAQPAQTIKLTENTQKKKKGCC